MTSAAGGFRAAPRSGRPIGWVRSKDLVRGDTGALYGRVTAVRGRMQAAAHSKFGEILMADQYGLSLGWAPLSLRSMT